MGEDVIYELAARLGSIVTFDRHGWVMWMDGFEDGIAKWIPEIYGTDAAVAASTAYARNGAVSCKLTGGKTSLRLADIVRRLPYPILGKLGFESSWAMDDDLDHYGMYFYLYTGSQVIQSFVAYSHQLGKLQYVDSEGDLQELATGLNLYVSGYPFWTTKMVVDFQANEYVRVLLNDQVYDMSGIACQVADDETNPYLSVVCLNVTTEGKNGVVYVDDVIVTQNEP